MAKKAEKFPVEIYIYAAEEGGRNEYLAVARDITDATELGEENKVVAVYRLQKTIRVTNKTTVS